MIKSNGKGFIIKLRHRRSWLGYCNGRSNAFAAPAAPAATCKGCGCALPAGIVQCGACLCEKATP
jgi:hypothetical protein